MSDPIPVFALALSIVNLIFFILNYIRDRPRLQAKAEIIIHHQGPESDAETAMLQIRIANIGRRQITVLNLIFQGKGCSWSISIKEPKSKKNLLSIQEAVDLLHRHSLAQNSAIRLLEGDVIDIKFFPNDYNKLIFTHFDTPIMADSIQIEDFAGRRYRVRSRPCKIQPHAIATSLAELTPSPVRSWRARPKRDTGG